MRAAVGPRAQHEITARKAGAGVQYRLEVGALGNDERTARYTPVFPRDAGVCGPASDQTASRARPFARRALMTARPAFVFMRTLNPWVRLRRVLEG